MGDKLSRPGDPWEQADPAGEKSSACHTRLVPDVMLWHAEEELLLGQELLYDSGSAGEHVLWETGQITGATAFYRMTVVDMSASFEQRQ